MPPGGRSRPQLGPSPSLSSSPPFSLGAHPREAYRDLLVFEERLKQNSARLHRQRKKYEAFLASLVASILVLAYWVALSPPKHKLVQFANLGLLLIGIVTLILFFATGVYSEKIAYAYKFVPQANRALRYFNIYLNTKQPPRRWSINPLRLLRPAPIVPVVSPHLATPPLPNRYAQANVGNRKKTGSSSTAPGAANTSSFVNPRSRSPASARQHNAVPLAPIPPANNPRGEIIFSSKVSQPYREGYEKYRSDWERKRALAKKARGRSGSSSSLHTRWPRPLRYLLPSWWTASPRGSSSSGKHSLQGTTGPYHRGHELASQSKYASRGAYAVSSDFSDSSAPPSRPTSPHVDDATTTTTTTSDRVRGRDTQARPLIRSGSSSSVSTTFSISPPSSRRPSPLRHSISASNSSKPNRRTSSGSSPPSAPSTPELIREEDDDDDYDGGPDGRRTDRHFIAERLHDSRYDGPLSETSRRSPSSSSEAASLRSEQDHLNENAGMASVAMEGARRKHGQQGPEYMRRSSIRARVSSFNEILQELTETRGET